MKINRAIGLLFVLAFLLLTLDFREVFASTAQSSTAQSSTAQSFVAKFSNGPANARVGIVVQDGKYKAYVCSLDNEFNLIAARWYEGDVVNGQVSGISLDGVQFEATLAGSSFKGRVTDLNKKTLEFRGSQIKVGQNHAGLYRGKAEVNGKNVIVGAVIGMDGSFASTVQFDQEIRFVTPIAPKPNLISSEHLVVWLGADKQPAIASLVNSLN
jgi:hypothetical protein